MSDIAPGWYSDPADPATQRYWDGECWLGDPLPADATPPAGPPPAAPPPAAPPPVPAPAVGVREQQPAIVLTRPVPLPPGYRPPAPTPHGYTIAHPGLRLAARAIDTVALLLLNVAVNGWFAYRWWRDFWPYYVEFARRYANHQSVNDIPVPQTQSLVVVIFVIGVALWFAYEVPALANNGQTLGKRLVGIRVLRLDVDGPLGFGRAWRRWNPLGLSTFMWLCYLFGFILQFVDCLFVLIDHPLHQALHDKAAATVVVHVKKERA